MAPVRLGLPVYIPDRLGTPPHPPLPPLPLDTTAFKSAKSTVQATASPGGGSEAKTVCVPKIHLQFQAPLEEPRLPFRPPPPV